MICVVLGEVLVTALAIHHTHHVQPTNKLCVPCHTLKDIITLSYKYFRSNTTILFADGKYYHTYSDMIIQSIVNFSFIGTANTSDPTSPVSVIKCLPEHII